MRLSVIKSKIEDLVFAVNSHINCFSLTLYQVFVVNRIGMEICIMINQNILLNYNCFFFVYFPGKITIMTTSLMDHCAKIQRGVLIDFGTLGGGLYPAVVNLQAVPSDHYQYLGFLKLFVEY